jgi:chromosome segregation ATPase
MIAALTTKVETTTATTEEKILNFETKITVELMEVKQSISAINETNNSLVSEVAELRRSHEQDMKAFHEHSAGLEKSIANNAGRIDALISTVATGTNDLQDTRIKVENLEDRIDSLKHELDEQEERSPTNCYSKEESDESTEKLITTITLLQKKLAAVEYASSRSQQNSRKFNVEIDGIPLEVGDEPDKLEEVVLKLFEKMDIPCESKDIDAIHRLPSKTPEKGKGTIVRLHRRKLRYSILTNKAKLKHLCEWNLDIAGLNNESKIFVKPNLCPYYKTLAYNCRVLKRNGLIASTSVDDDGTVKIKTLENEHVKILHETKLRQWFPDFRWFKFSASEH